jgi:hypothetical protein
MAAAPSNNPFELNKDYTAEKFAKAVFCGPGMGWTSMARHPLVTIIVYNLLITSL